MPSKNLVAHAETLVHAQIEKVWDALINPDMIKKYMFGTNVISDWTEGSKIVFRGE